jgi:hypothetical protein
MALALLPLSVGCTGIVGSPETTGEAIGGSPDATSSGIAPSAPVVPMPLDYRIWPTFLPNVQRSDVGQVRDIYVNAVGNTATEGQPFPEGTVLAMDVFSVQTNASGTLLLDPSGMLLKNTLLKTLIMEKNAGWGQYVPADLRNGDWLYASYGSDKTLLADPVAPCFSCHLPLGASVDWVQSYAKYFQMRVAPVTN